MAHTRSMRNNLKILADRIFKNKVFDYFISLIIILPACLLYVYRRYGSAKLPITSARLKSIGIFPILNHYYEPFFSYKLLKKQLDSKRNLPGIDLNDVGQILFLSKLTYADELLDLKLSCKSFDSKNFYINNGSFESGDAEYLYQFIRRTKPQKVVEIGSGNSTKIARMALMRNKVETRRDYKHICIEPYEQPWLDKLSDIEIVRSRVEDLDIDWSSFLESGDLLFIDSSHIIRPQGDVLKEYLEIMPLLQVGVNVHIHDIFTPRDYLKYWLVDEIRFWNEQYLLEALLSNSDRYRIVGALNYLKNDYYDELKKVCPYLTIDREPGSFYIEII